jgi:hypothetical protein
MALLGLLIVAVTGCGGSGSSSSPSSSGSTVSSEEGSFSQQELERCYEAWNASNNETMQLLLEGYATDGQIFVSVNPSEEGACLITAEVPKYSQVWQFLEGSAPGNATPFGEQTGHTAELPESVTNWNSRIVNGGKLVQAEAGSQGE